jgi:N-acetylneuraminic acid mutarotase
MKTSYNISVIVILLSGTAIYLPSCKKEAAIPVVTTSIVKDITQTTALSGGTVTDDGGASVLNRGVAYSTSHDPEVGYTYTKDGAGTGSFSSKITGLSGSTTYYVRAFATNSAGTGYGNEVSFKSNEISVATLTTINVTAITSTTATSGGKIPSSGGTPITEWGICWSNSHNPIITDQVIKIKMDQLEDVVPDTAFTVNLSGLIPGTTYFVRAYAINSVGAAYGNEVTFTTSAEQQGLLHQIANFPGGPRYNAAGISIGTKFYLGLGYDDGDNPRRDFWEWDQATDVWTKKADYPGTATGGAVGFSIGTKGYIGTGSNFSTVQATNEFWEYDPATNTWAEKSSLPDAYGRAWAVGFSIGTKGYIGTGFWFNGTTGSYYKDFWEWDQVTNVWTKKADFPGNAQTQAVGFSIGNKGYIGTGSGAGQALCKDFWEWDQATNTWTRKADFGGASRALAVGFSIGNKGYIGTGYTVVGNTENLYKDFWEWDQATNVWIQKTDLAGDPRASAIGFSIGNKGYIGIGTGGNITYAFRDFWEYDPTIE